MIKKERARLRERERMLYSFRKEDNLKVKIVFQRKIFTLCMCFCVCVFVFLCSAMQVAIQWYDITPAVFHVFSVT